MRSNFNLGKTKEICSSKAKKSNLAGKAKKFHPSPFVHFNNNFFGKKTEFCFLTEIEVPFGTIRFVLNF